MLFGVFSHDIKNPVMAVMGYSEMLYEDIDSMSDEEIRGNLLKAKNAGVNLNNLTDNVLNWSLLNLNKLVIKYESFDAAEVVNRIFEILESHAELKKVKLIQETASGMTVYSDPNLYSVVLRNFLTNAVKFTDSGKSVFVKVTIEDGFLITVIKDEGMSMKPEMLEEVYSGKVKSRQGTKSEKGTGLGMTISMAALTKLSGKMHIKSFQGEGTEITISIPIDQKAAL